MNAWHVIRGWLQGRNRAKALPDTLWFQSIAPFPFLTMLLADDQRKLRWLVGQFLAQKEFHGAGGLVVTDAMAIAIAAQACLPLLHLQARPGRAGLGRGTALVWYDDFVGIVVHRAEVVAHREHVDEAGVVHRYDEVLAGEAMERGPVMLNWADVADAGTTAGRGYNVVIHEFAHKIDMAGGVADGCPPLWPGFMGHRSSHSARKAWLATWQPAFEGFCEQVVIAERFGGTRPWLDAYGTHGLEEFFAVVCEAYFVNRDRFGSEWPALLALLDAFYRSDTPLRAR